MIENIDLMKIFTTFLQPNIKFLSIILLLIILSAKYLDTNVIFIISIIIYIFSDYKKILETFDTIKSNESKSEKIIEDNKRKKKIFIFQMN